MVGLVPAFIWLFFWTREDVTHPEPRKVIAGCFLGGVVAVFAAFFIENWLNNHITSNLDLFNITALQFKYTSWVITEEILKFIVLIIAVMSTADDEPIDAMIYAISIALGFSAMENMFFITQPFITGQVANGIAMGAMRFIGATLVHTVSTGIIGFCIGFVFYRRRYVKIILGIVGLLIAIILHTIFNLSIIDGTDSAILKTFGWFWLAVVVLIILFEEIKAVKPKLLKNK